MNYRVGIALAACASITACAPQQERIRNTASGYPEGLFKNTTVDEVRNKVIAGCDMRGTQVQEASGNTVVCGKTMTGGDAVVAQMLIGNSYSTTPQQKVRFTIYQLGSDVKVSARQWIETQMAFGQMRQTELNANNHFNEIQNFIDSLGASHGSSTTYNATSKIAETKKRFRLCCFDNEAAADQYTNVIRKEHKQLSSIYINYDAPSKSLYTFTMPVSDANGWCGKLAKDGKSCTVGD